MKMIVDQFKKIYQFDSVDEQIRHALDTVKKVKKGGGDLKNEGFFRCGSSLMRTDLTCWSDLEKALTTPWSQGISIIEELRRKIPDQSSDFSSRRRRRSTSEIDGEVDFDRWMAGRSDFFDLPVSIKVQEGSRFVSLAFANGMSCNITGASAFIQAASIVAAVDKLEEQGVQVELSMYSIGDGVYKKGPRSRIVTTILKRSGEPVNVESLASAVSPWYFRLVGLTNQIADTLEFPVDSGMGWPSYEFSRIKNLFSADTQEIVRSFNLDGAIKTFMDISSMISKEGDAGYGS
jgi:hypothetical protein